MRSLLTFAAVVTIGVGQAALVQAAGLSAAAGFGWGMTYMIAASLVLNSCGRARA